MASLPYERSTTTGERALSEMQKTLRAFGCTKFGNMTDDVAGTLIVQFEYRQRQVVVTASAKGYAADCARARPAGEPARGGRTGEMTKNGDSLEAIGRDYAINFRRKPDDRHRSECPRLVVCGPHRGGLLGRRCLAGAGMTQPEALREALQALLMECLSAGHGSDRDYGWPKVIADARAALEAQGAPKPESESRYGLVVKPDLTGLSRGVPPATPQAAIGAEPPEPPEPLTDERIVEIRDRHLPNQGEPFDCLAYARSIERAVVRRLAVAEGQALAAPGIGVPVPSSSLLACLEQVKRHWLNGKYSNSEGEASLLDEVNEWLGHQAQAVASSPAPSSEVDEAQLQRLTERGAVAWKGHQTESDSSAVQRPAGADWREFAKQLIARGGPMVRAAYNDIPGPSCVDLASWMQDAMRTMHALSPSTRPLVTSGTSAEYAHALAETQRSSHTAGSDEKEEVGVPAEPALTDAQIEEIIEQAWASAEHETTIGNEAAETEWTRFGRKCVRAALAHRSTPDPTVGTTPDGVEVRESDLARARHIAAAAAAVGPGYKVKP